MVGMSPKKDEGTLISSNSTSTTYQLCNRGQIYDDRHQHAEYAGPAAL